MFSPNILRLRIAEAKDGLKISRLKIMIIAAILFVEDCSDNSVDQCEPVASADFYAYSKNRAIPEVTCSGCD